ncbi:MAG: signal peptidase II [Candidatus Omnitrophota bacterium]
MIPIIVLAVLSLDQLTKFLSTRYISPQHSVAVVKNVFHLTLVFNRGAAFGILKNQVPLFILTSFLAIILVCFNLKEEKYGRLYKVSLALILGGAVGNMIDRVIFGHVIDFLDFRIWPVFNIADSAISIGTVMLAWCILRPKNAVHSS